MLATLLLETEYADLLSRSAADPGNLEAKIDDHVELEKSNVLLMGPTGSGTASLL